VLCTEVLSKELELHKVLGMELGKVLHKASRKALGMVLGMLEGTPVYKLEGTRVCRELHRLVRYPSFCNRSTLTRKEPSFRKRETRPIFPVVFSLETPIVIVNSNWAHNRRWAKLC
jgi:hypothetical protein